MKKIIIAICIALVIFSGVASANDAIPTLPLSLYGTAQTNEGTPIPIGTEISAHLNGEQFSYIITEAGAIGSSETFGKKFLLSPTEQPTKTQITFTVGAVQAPQTVEFESGKTASITLTFAIGVETAGDKQTLLTAPPVIVSENPVPNDFALKIETVPQEKTLPPATPQTALLKTFEMTPINPPAGDFSIIITISATLREIADLGLTKDTIAILHHNEALNKWETLITTISDETADTVTYSAKVDDFSAFALGTVSKPVQTENPSMPPASPSASGNQPSPIPQQTPIPTVTSTPTETEQEQLPTEIPSSPQPTETPKSPAPLLGLITALGVCVMLRKR